VRDITDASQSVQDVARIITDVKASISETGSSADGVLGAADDLARLSNNLKTSIDDFLAHIREDKEELEHSEAHPEIAPVEMTDGAEQIAEQNEDIKQTG